MLSVAATAAAAAEEEGLPEPKLLPIALLLLLLLPVVPPPVPVCSVDCFGGAVLGGACAGKGSASHSMCPGCLLSCGGRRKQARKEIISGCSSYLPGMYEVYICQG